MQLTILTEKNNNNNLTVSTDVQKALVKINVHLEQKFSKRNKREFP